MIQSYRFGANKSGEINGQEKIPDNWTNKVEPYTSQVVTQEILAQYLRYPVLFEGETTGSTFDLISYGLIEDGKLNIMSVTTMLYLLYQVAIELVPTSLNSAVISNVDSLSFLLSKLGNRIKNLDCPNALI